MLKSKKQSRIKVRHSIRKKVSGTAKKPRLSVFRSNRQIYAQLIDDVSGTTITSASSQDKSLSSEQYNKVSQAVAVGKLIAKNAKDSGIESIVFDRGGFLYHGRIKALAESARESGLKF